MQRSGLDRPLDEEKAVSPIIMSTGRATSHLSCKAPDCALRRELSAPLEAGRRKRLPADGRATAAR
jgi:hypothetical protein